jgi:hypothetical protein
MSNNSGKKKMKLSRFYLLAKSKWTQLLEFIKKPKDLRDFERLRNFLTS